MGLNISTNPSGLIATNQLNKTTQLLTKSLQKLTTGSKINGADDGPTGLILSEFNKAQLSGIGAALSNTGKAYSMVSIADSAMKELSTILTNLRSTAVDAANRGTQDASSTASAQADVRNLLQTFDRIVGQTQYADKKLLSGAFAPTVTNSNSANSIAVVTGTVKNDGVTSGSINAIISAGAQAAKVLGAGAFVAPTTDAVTLKINGVNVGLNGTNAATIGATVTAINGYSSQTGVTAYNSGGSVLLVANTFGSSGNFTASVNVDSGADFTGLTALAAPGSQVLTVSSGTDIAGTINGQAGIGSGGTLSSADGNIKITYYQGAVNKYTSDATATQMSVNYGASQTFQIGNNAGDTMGVMIRDLSSSALGRGTTGLNSVTDPLAITSNAATAAFYSLANIDVTSSKNAADAVKIIDNAIGELNQQRAVLGSFLSSALTPTQDNLSSVTESSSSMQSTFIDTNYAEEMANQTKLLVQAQAQSAILQVSKQMGDLVLSLMK